MGVHCYLTADLRHDRLAPLYGIEHRLAEVAEQVPSVRHPYSVRRSLSRALRIGASPVAGDDLHARMALQPIRQGAQGAARQQVDRSISLQVQQNGAVPTASAPSPVVDPECAGRGLRFGGPVALVGRSQQSVGPGRGGRFDCPAGRAARGPSPAGRLPGSPVSSPPAFWSPAGWPRKR